MPQVHSYVAKQTGWPHGASIEKYCCKRKQMVFFWFHTHLRQFSSFFQRKSSKKRVFANHLRVFEGRQKFFYSFLTYIVCVRWMPQVHSYVTKQTGWPHDVSIEKYCCKLKQMMFFFGFHTRSKSIFGRSKLMKIPKFSMFFQLQIALENFLGIKQP